MLTMTMTADEMGQHIETDIRKMERWLDYQYHAFMKKVKKRPPRLAYYKICEKTVKTSHQKYYFVLTHTCLDGKKFDVLWTIVAELRDYARTYYVFPKSALDNKIRMFSSHLIKRYAERIGIPFSEKSLFEFINRNICQCCIYKDNPDEPTKMVYAAADGLILSQVTDKNLCIGRTFISKDMLKTTQREAFERIYDTVVDATTQTAKSLRMGYDKDRFASQYSRENRYIFESCQEIYTKYFESA